MTRKLHLKTWKNWGRDLDSDYDGVGLEPRRVQEQEGNLDTILIGYYGHDFAVTGPFVTHTMSFEGGVFQGVWHGPGPARKATRKFYILDRHGKGEYLTSKRNGRKEWKTHPPTYTLYSVTLPKGATHRLLRAKLLIEKTDAQLDKMIGLHVLKRPRDPLSWEKRSPQYIATKLLEVSK
jgi:hypothetical protein